MVSTSSFVLATIVATVLQQAAAHTVMISPVPVFPPNEYDKNSPVAEMEIAKLPGGAGASGYSADRIVSAIQATEGKTLRALIRKNAKAKFDIDCGKTVLTGPKQQVPDEIDFPWGHIGPCEAWCDDTRVFYDDNCRGNNIGKIKVDKSKCTNAKRLQVMYVGVHSTPNYEVYANCVALSGSGTDGNDGGDNNDDNDDASTSTPPASTPKVSPAPAATHKPAATPKPVATQPATEAPYPPGTVSPPGSNTGGGKHCGVTSDLDSWCTANCGMGFCPETHCKKC